MRIEQLNVVLRERNHWQAMELGSALVRRRARVVWGAWLLASLPLLVLVNVLALWRGSGFFLAWLLMWWCKPAFERVVLYVLSRDVFGEPVGVLQALRAQRHWGGGGFWGYLGWRRPSVVRNVCLPVNLLEGAQPAQRAQRRHAVLAGTFGPALLLSLACVAFEVVLVLGTLTAVFLFVPVELLSDSWRAAWQLVSEDTPAWAKLCLNLVCWGAASVMGPFHIGAGFGLYLARRTEMEAWDVELGLRRLRARLLQSAPLLAVLLAVAWTTPWLVPAATAQQASPAAPHAGADEADEEVRSGEAHKRAAVERWRAQHPDSAPQIFGEAPVDTAGFRQAVQRGYEDPLQRPVRTVTRWVPRADLSEAEQEENEDPWLAQIRALFAGSAGVVALGAEGGLWLLLAVLLVVLALTARRWLPWLRFGRRPARATPSAVREDSIMLPEALPADVATQARALWAQGRPRQALALLYRASMQSVEARGDLVMPPGTTEAQALRLSRRMPDPRDRELFAAVVRMWQYAAYGNRLPDEQDFLQLAGHLQAQYRWQA